jgi:hypothetical protein
MQVLSQPLKPATFEEFSVTQWGSQFISKRHHDHPTPPPLEARRRLRCRRRPAGHQHRANARHGPQSRHQLCAHGCTKIVGRDGAHPSRCQDRRAPSRCVGKRFLRGQRPCPHALVQRLQKARWSSPPKRARAISFTCRPERHTHCRIKKSTPAPPKCCSACWCAATAKRWRSTWTSHQWSSQKTWPGSTPSIAPEHTFCVAARHHAHRNRRPHPPRHSRLVE